MPCIIRSKSAYFSGMSRTKPFALIAAAIVTMLVSGVAGALPASAAPTMVIFDISQPNQPPNDPIIVIFQGGQGTEEWYSLGLENGRDPITFATFDRWVDHTDTSTSPVEVDGADGPQPGHLYKAVWIPYATPIDPLSVEIAGQVFTGLSGSPARSMIWTADTLDSLPVSLRMAPNTNWHLVLSAADSRGALVSQASLDGLESVLSADALDIRSLDGCDHSVTDPSCPTNLVLTLTTTYDGQNKKFTFYIMRTSATDLSRLTFDLQNPYYIPGSAGNDWTGMQTYGDAGPRWEKVVTPDEVVNVENWSPNSYFGGWCTTENPSNFDSCYQVGDFIPVTSDIVLYSLWVESAAPESIRVGRVNITSADAIDWIVDDELERIYVTVESDQYTQLVGDISVVGSTGIKYSATPRFIEDPTGPLVPDSQGSYSLGTGCHDSGVCFYYLSYDFHADSVFSTQHPWGTGNFGIYLIVKPAGINPLNVSFDTGGGTSLSAQSLPAGWHQPSNVTRQGYTRDFWSDNITGSWGMWESYYPVLADQTLSLHWNSGPIATSFATRTITQGQTAVATATTDEQDVIWRLVGSSDFSISSNGDITAHANLPAGVYTFDISAQSWIEGPRFRMTVTVEAPAGISSSGHQGSSQNSGGGVTSPPQVEVKPVPKPEPKAEPLAKPSPISSVSRSKLGVGATANVLVKGGLAKSVVKYSTANAKVCSVDSSGSVIAKSVGACLINAQVLSADPDYAPAVVGPIRITVLGQGLVDSATLKVKNGNVTVVASLLKKNAGKRASLFQVRQVAGKSVLISRGWVRLDRNAVATFSSFKQGKTPAKLVVMVDGMKVYELASK
jgi:hypothetical protein